MLSQGEDPRIARRRAGFDDQKRVACLGPQLCGERASFCVADLADHVACHHKLGRLGTCECSAGFAPMVGHLPQACTVVAKIERQCTQGGIGIH